jgi:LacI family transcriptional regulator
MADPDRVVAFRRAARRLGLVAVPVYASLTMPAVQRAVGRLLTRPDPPTAVVTNSDYTAHAVYKAARSLGVVVGAGLSVIGHDDLPTSELLDPPLTTLRLDRRSMGRALMHRLLDPELRTDHLEPVALVERSSLAAPVRLPAISLSPQRHRR